MLFDLNTLEALKTVGPRGKTPLSAQKIGERRHLRLAEVALHRLEIIEAEDIPDTHNRVSFEDQIHELKIVHIRMKAGSTISDFTIHNPEGGDVYVVIDGAFN